jgi:hypothetical protein
MTTAAMALLGGPVDCPESLGGGCGSVVTVAGLCLGPPTKSNDGAAVWDLAMLPQHPDQHRSERPVLLAVDQ